MSASKLAGRLRWRGLLRARAGSLWPVLCTQPQPTHTHDYFDWSEYPSSWLTEGQEEYGRRYNTSQMFASHAPLPAASSHSIIKCGSVGSARLRLPTFLLPALLHFSPAPCLQRACGLRSFTAIGAAPAGITKQASQEVGLDATLALSRSPAAWRCSTPRESPPPRC